MDARIHYVIENKESKLLEVTMWDWYCCHRSIFVNGIEIEEDFLFYDLIMPFLPEDAAKVLKDWTTTTQGDDSVVSDKN